MQPRFNTNHWLEVLWYRKHPLRWLLWPISLVYRIVCAARRWVLTRFYAKNAQVPVIVVGNISVGGVGKTPLVIALANALRTRGLRVGVVSRGYKAKVKTFPYEVNPKDSPELTGDEPCLIARKTECPVVIAPNRVAAVDYLVSHHHVQVVISDDGLQHYAMARQFEIAVIDGARGLGNGLCLPAGPLREPSKRLKQVDAVVVNGREALSNAHAMRLEPGVLRRIHDDKPVAVSELSGAILAVAAIGNPERFFTTLRDLGLQCSTRVFGDHHAYQAEDLHTEARWIIMTEKDAVKCRSFADERMLYLPVDAKLGDTFWHTLYQHPALKSLEHGR